MLFFLFLAAELQKSVRRPCLHIEINPDRAVDPGKFLRDQGVGQEAQVISTVFLRYEAAVKAEIPHFCDQVPTEGMFLIVFCRGWQDLLFGKVTRQFPDRCLFFG